MTKFATLSPDGSVDVVYLYDPRPRVETVTRLVTPEPTEENPNPEPVEVVEEINVPGIDGAIEIPDNVFWGFVKNGDTWEAPPPAPPSIDEQIAVVDAIYQPKLAGLRERLSTVILFDGPTMDAKMADLRLKYATMWAEYSEALDNI